MATNVPLDPLPSREMRPSSGRYVSACCEDLGKCQPQKQLVSWPLPCSGAATLWFWRHRAARGAQRPSAAKSGSSLFQPHLTSVRMAATYEKFHGTHDINLMPPFWQD